MLKAIESRFVSYDKNRDDLLQYGSVRYPTLPGDNEPEGLKKIVHTSIIYADFYFTEAILKLLSSKFNPW